MVEIIPYEEDDEDESLWAPLNVAADGENAGAGSTPAPAPVFSLASSTPPVRASPSRSRGVFQKRDASDAVLDAFVEFGVAGGDLITRLTSTPASALAEAPTHDAANDSDGSESDANGPWRRLDSNGEDDLSIAANAAVRGRSGGEGERNIPFYRSSAGGDDDDTGGVRTKGTGGTAVQGCRPKVRRPSPGDGAGGSDDGKKRDDCSEKNDDGSALSMPPWAPPYEQAPPPLRDPLLRILSRSFLRHLFHGTTDRLLGGFTILFFPPPSEFEVYCNGFDSFVASRREQRASLVLSSLLALLGTVWIARGSFALASLAVRWASAAGRWSVVKTVRAVVSVAQIWAVVVVMAVGAACFLPDGRRCGGNGSDGRSGENFARRRRAFVEDALILDAPKIRRLLPVWVFLTSPAFPEATAVFLSTRVLLSIGTASRSECDNNSGYSGSDGSLVDDVVLSMSSIFLLLAVASIVFVGLLVSIIVSAHLAEYREGGSFDGNAKEREERKEERKNATSLESSSDERGCALTSDGDSNTSSLFDSTTAPSAALSSFDGSQISEMKANDGAPPVSPGKNFFNASVSIGILVPRTARLVAKHVDACHRSAVLALMILATASFIAERAYLDGGRVSAMGAYESVGFLTHALVSVACGSYLLVWAWRIGRVSSPSKASSGWGEAFAIALKRSCAEVAGDMLLSENDGRLRLAVLEWLVDRWTAKATTGTAAAAGAMTEETAATRPPPIADEERWRDGAEERGEESLSPPLPSPRSEGASSPRWKRSGRADNVPSLSNNEFNDQTDYHNAFRNSRNPAAAAATTTTLPPPSSYDALRSVVDALDADEHLVPAVERYRASVESMPPTANVAVGVALLRRFPTALAVGLLVLSLMLSRLCHLLSMLLPNQIAGWWKDDKMGVAGDGAGGSWIAATVMTCATTVPLAYLESLRVRRWWAATIDGRNGSLGGEGGDSMAILLDTNDINNSRSSSSGSLLGLWRLVLESVMVLESSVKVVRCTTVVCAAADLAGDALCLLELVANVQRLGFAGGLGLILWDAFHFRFRDEVVRRRREDGHHDFGSDGDIRGKGSVVTGNGRSSQGGGREYADSDDGKYTDAVVGAVGNWEKMSRNISGLMDSGSFCSGQRRRNDGLTNNELESKSRRLTSPPTTSSTIIPTVLRSVKSPQR